MLTLEQVTTGDERHNRKQKQKEHLHKISDSLCFFCGRFLAVEQSFNFFITPKKDGGMNALSNTVMVCGQCVNISNNLTVEETLTNIINMSSTRTAAWRKNFSSRLQNYLARLDDEVYDSGVPAEQIDNMRNHNRYFCQKILFGLYPEVFSQPEKPEVIHFVKKVLLPTKKNWLMDTYKNSCFYCGKSFSHSQDVTYEHVSVASKGGCNNNTNIVPSCEPCNHRRGNEDFTTYCLYLMKKMNPSQKQSFCQRLEIFTEVIKNHQWDTGSYFLMPELLSSHQQMAQKNIDYCNILTKICQEC